MKLALASLLVLAGCGSTYDTPIYCAVDTSTLTGCELIQTNKAHLAQATADCTSGDPAGIVTSTPCDASTALGSCDFGASDGYVTAYYYVSTDTPDQAHAVALCEHVQGTYTRLMF